MLRAEPVLLGAAGDEAVLDDDPRGGGDTLDVVELLAVPNRRLVQQVVGDDRVHGVERLRLSRVDVHGAFGQRQATGARAGLGVRLVGDPKRHRGLVALLERHAAGQIRLARRIGDDALNQAVDADGVDKRAGVLLDATARGHERRPLAIAYRSAQVALEGSLLIRCLLRRKRIAGCHRRVAKDHVGGAVKCFAAGLGDDFNPAAPGPGELRRIGILVDLDLLDGRRAHADAVGFGAVDHQRHAVGADGGRVQESRHHPDVVLIEHRKVLERRLIRRDGVEVPGARSCRPAATSW